MRLMTMTTRRKQAGTLARMSASIGQHQQELSDRVHAAADEHARQHGWEITKSTGRLGFGTRTYRDPRFNNRRQQLAVSQQDAAMPPVRRRSGQLEIQGDS